MSLNRFERAVRDRCLIAGAAGEQASYGEVAESVGLTRNDRHHLRLMERALKAILRDDHRNGRPLACVATVRADSRLPGWGFADMCFELGHFTGGDYRAFVEREWQKLRHYCTTLRLVPAPVTPAPRLLTAG